MPAALVALRSIWNFPSVGTCERVSTPNDQLTGLGHCCQTESSRGSDGPFNAPLDRAPEEQIPDTSLEDSVTGKSSPGGFHTYDPVLHRVPCPVTEGSVFSVPSSLIPETVNHGGVGKRNTPTGHLFCADDLDPVDLAVDVRAALKPGVEPLLALRERRSAVGAGRDVLPEVPDHDAGSPAARVHVSVCGQRLLIVIPGGAVVIQYAFSPSGITLTIWIVIGQLEGTMNDAGSRTR